MLLGDEARFFPTQYTANMRSFLTTDATSKSNAPYYQEKIEEFKSSDIDTKLKDFVFSNPNLNCLI